MSKSKQEPVVLSEYEARKTAVVLARNWAALFLLFLIVVFSFSGGAGFFSATNLQNVLHLSTTFLILAAAQTFVIISGGIDLSIGFVMGLSSVSAAKIMQILHAGDNPVGMTILIGMFVGLVVAVPPGLVSGILIAKYKVPPFIATLGMWGITNGITLHICEGFPVGFLPQLVTKIGNGFLFFILPGKESWMLIRPDGLSGEEIRSLTRIIPSSTIFVVVLLLILWHILHNTKFGQHNYAIGGNEDAALRSGIHVRRHLIIVYTLSSFLAGIAGVFNVFQTGIGNFTPFTAMYELYAVAAVVIGGASLSGGSGRIFGSVIGVMLIATLENGLSISGVAPFYRFIAVGLILILAVTIDQLFPKLISRRAAA
ncbi:MAG: ABC transporter permease [Spirochaetales bacterium]|nr:ABC transporter permease [Spirochaetales bacterium]MCF7938019.1 ABC transporter permease [Spirochaetales bacterium]